MQQFTSYKQSNINSAMNVPALLTVADAEGLIVNFPATSSLLGTGSNPGADIAVAVIPGAGIIKVDMANILKFLFSLSMR